VCKIITPSQQEKAMHTKGPWVIANIQDEWHEGMDGVIAQSCNELEIRPAGDQKLGDEIADLRLMAYAPELLAQLEFAVKLLKPFAETAQVQSMINVIAKATGEQ
jgi:hypothetical protein